MRRYVQREKVDEFIVGTEDGIIHALKKENPHKIFYPVGTICKGMKKIDLEKVQLSLERMRHIINIPEYIRLKSRIALVKMLKVKKTRNLEIWMDDEHMLLDTLYNRKNTGSKGLFHNKRAIAIDPNQPDPYFNLGLNIDIKINTINEEER